MMDERSYLSGYADGEGCFCVTFDKSRRHKFGWDIRPSFSVSQNADRAEVLLIFQRVLQCGFIRPDRSDRTIKYEVRSVSDLANRVLPHFQQYPLLSSKRKDFEVFAAIVQMMHNGEHLEERGFERTVQLASTLNVLSKKRYVRSEIVLADKGIVYATRKRELREVPTCTNGITT
jgi:hypothetical protein